MTKSRLEAFSDGVIAIIITIMVLELKVPRGSDLAALRPLLPIFLSYVLSFVFVGIYWNNHHHLLHVATKVTGGIMWANLHLLFWLSLVPFACGWLGGGAAEWPTALYGIVLLGAALAYVLLQVLILRQLPAGSPVLAAFRTDLKAMVSLASYVAAIPLSFVRPWIAWALYVFVATVWLVPDRRIERTLQSEDD
jgi:uncharacterized membrane protein